MVKASDSKHPGGSLYTKIYLQYSTSLKALNNILLEYEERNILQISLIKLQSDLECDSWEPPSI